MVSEANKARIIQQFFMGYSLRKSQASMGKTVKSPETVRSVRDAFLRHVEEKQGRFGSERGLRIAARDWNVTELVDQLLAVGTEADKARVELHEVIDSVPVAKILVEAGVDVKDLLRFIREVYNRSKQVGYTVESMMNDCQEMNELEAKYGSFDEIKKDHVRIGFEITELERKRDGLNIEMDKAVDRKKKLLADYGMTEVKLKAFEKTRRFLISIGITEDDAERATNVLSNIKDQKFNMKKVVSKLKRIEDLDDKIARQKADFTEGGEDLERLSRHLESVETKIKEKSGVLQEAHRAEESGLSVEQMAKLRATVARISSKKGIPPAEAMAKFEDEVGKKYDLVLGFEQDIQAKREELKIADEGLGREKRLTDEMKQTRTGLEDQYAKRKKEIDAYSSLRKRGVDDEAILRWNNIVTSTNLTPGAIESELVKAGDLSKLRSKMKEDADGEEKRSKELQAISEMYWTQHKTVKDAVRRFQRLREKGVETSVLQRWEKIVVDAGLDPSKLEDELLEQRNLNVTKQERQKKLEELEGEVRAAEDRKTELGKISATAVTELNTSVADLKLQEKADEVKKQIESIRDTAVDSLSDVEKAGERITRLEPIGSAYAFLAGEESDLTEPEVLLISATYLQNLLKWEKQKKGITFRSNELEHAIEELLKSKSWSSLLPEEKGSCVRSLCKEFQRDLPTGSGLREASVRGESQERGGISVGLESHRRSCSADSV